MPISLPRLLLRYLSLLGFLALLSLSAHAQTATPVPMPNAMSPQQPAMLMLNGDRVYNYVEQMPAYLNGGIEGLQSFITSHVHGGAASGPLSVVTFIVDKTGHVRRPALGPTAAESEEAVTPALAEAFRTVGQFRPGRQNGQPTNVVYTLPLVKRMKASKK